jgi:hypothetical protein
MDEQAKKEIDNLEVNSTGLETLLKRALLQCEEDFEEAEENVQTYKTELINNKDLGKEMFGSLHSDALRIKGQARERYLKIINLFKDRVKTKELIQGSKEGLGTNPEDMLRMIDDYMDKDND